MTHRKKNWENDPLNMYVDCNSENANEVTSLLSIISVLSAHLKRTHSHLRLEGFFRKENVINRMATATTWVWSIPALISRVRSIHSVSLPRGDPARFTRADKVLFDVLRVLIYVALHLKSDWKILQRTCASSHGCETKRNKVPCSTKFLI